MRTLIVAAALLIGTAAIAPAAVAAPSTAPQSGASRPAASKPATAARAACSAVPQGRARCLARYRTTGLRSPGVRGTDVRGARAATPPGLAPADIADAYHLAGARTTTRTVAVVDAYDDPNAEADLAVYRSTYGLPPCTTANGCFRKVNQRGAKGPLPETDEGWGVEISLDLDAVSAACPTCHLRLVEADDSLVTSLGAAEDTAVRLGAAVVSNSFGAQEYGGQTAVQPRFVHPGTPIVASVGDSGFGPPASFPADLTSTIAVGGTKLVRAPGTARGWSESAWSGSQSACSAYVAKPSWQHDPHCSMRTLADVSAVADPSTGLAVYDSFLSYRPGWLIVGGTSLSAPLIAAMVARAGHPLDNAERIYASPGALYDPVGGSSGRCGHDYLCMGKVGYDAPTGAGSPNGVGAL